MTAASLVLPTPLVSTAWLAEHLQSPDLRIVDASWYLPAMGRDSRAEHEAAHIPGAVFWDLDRLSDLESSLPHMLPDADRFAREVGGLGIGSRHAVVAYDGSGTNLSAPRVWWTFRVFGHDRVAVLDGGLVRWRAEGRALESGTVTHPPAEFAARFRSELVRSLADVRESLADRSVQRVDARSEGRFAGTEPEPRPGLRGGHIPGARNVPYGDLVTADGLMLPPDDLRRRFEAAGIDLERPVIASCGSGVSACALALALDVIGHRGHAVYDGSWAEWGGRPDVPVERGPAGS